MPPFFEPSFWITWMPSTTMKAREKIKIRNRIIQNLGYWWVWTRVEICESEDGILKGKCLCLNSCFVVVLAISNFSLFKLRNWLYHIYIEKMGAQSSKLRLFYRKTLRKGKLVSSSAKCMGSSADFAQLLNHEHNVQQQEMKEMSGGIGMGRMEHGDEMVSWFGSWLKAGRENYRKKMEWKKYAGLYVLFCDFFGVTKYLNKKDIFSIFLKIFRITTLGEW